MDKFANLQAFVGVVESGSFTRSADRLGVAKSMVSRRVTELEQTLGAQLIQRTTRSLSLTAAGQQFYEHAVRILAALDEAEQALSSASSELRGRLRIAAPLSFGLRHLGEAVNDFLDRHAAIEIDLDLNDREVNLIEEGLDMAVRIGDLADSTLLARRLGTIRFVTCASPEYIARHGAPRTPDDLERHIGLHYNNVTPAQAWQYYAGDKRLPVVLPALRVRANNGDALAAAAVAGQGLVNSPTFIVSGLITDGRLVPLLQGYARPPVGIYAVFPPGRLVPRRVHAFADLLGERYGDLPQWDRAIGIEGG